MIGTVFWMVVLVAGILLMTFSSEKAVEHSVKIASALRISPLMIGLILVSIGTDLPEIANSIASSATTRHHSIQVNGRWRVYL